ncbi:MAG: tRNA 2-thiouridine(34) synthase MnmA [Parcubacteria group bacterium]
MKTVYVAMSGGVDSSVVAALVKKRGFSVVGVFFKPWSDSRDKSYCNWQQDRLDAMRVAVELGIRFETWDFSREYGEQVTKYMIDSYKNGITPNPDVICNQKIKFGIFLEEALKKGADCIATGHYARIRKNKNGTMSLLKGLDLDKDQSYFLWKLNQKQLKHSIFPIGSYKKDEVRKIAKRMGLGTHDKKDSQGVCFVGQLDMKDFLSKYIPIKTGEIVLYETGKVVGKHDSVCFYTIGQRHGFDIEIGGGPYYVYKKDIKKNILYVTKDKKILESSEVGLKNVSWISKMPEALDRLSVKIRYQQKEMPVQVKRGNRLYFKKPAFALASGQSAVIYRGSEVLGGGIIK